ncbi:hypothetical protein M2158_007982 [Streptomyces sp. SAI-144]|nr:hypothetical protein [Streptomyces sp. SAI-144]
MTIFMSAAGVQVLGQEDLVREVVVRVAVDAGGVVEELMDCDLASIVAVPSDQAREPPVDLLVEQEPALSLQLEHRRDEGLGDAARAVPVVVGARLAGLPVADTPRGLPDPVLVLHLRDHAGNAVLHGGVHRLPGCVAVVGRRYRALSLFFSSSPPSAAHHRH